MYTPILNNLVMTGRVIVDHMQYLGLASDGTLCVIGNTDQPMNTETYLTDYPTPDKW